VQFPGKGGITGGVESLEGGVVVTSGVASEFSVVEVSIVLGSEVEDCVVEAVSVGSVIGFPVSPVVVASVGFVGLIGLLVEIGESVVVGSIVDVNSEVSVASEVVSDGGLGVGSVVIGFGVDVVVPGHGSGAGHVPILKINKHQFLFGTYLYNLPHNTDNCETIVSHCKYLTRPGR